jgi:hypothetical protein
MMPMHIVNLRFLLVLDISQTAIEVLPSAFFQLAQLVYLHIDKRTKLMDGVGNLNSLQEFQGVTITTPTMLHDLGKLVELRNLRISFDEWNESYEEPFRQCLSNMVNLKTVQVLGAHLGVNSGCDNLSLQPQELHSIHSIDGICRAVPRWMSTLSCLSSIVIDLKVIRVEDLKVLGSIPSLSDLII